MNRDLWDKIWRDHNGHVVLWQTPNAWLIAWLVLDFVSLLMTGIVATILWYVASASLIIWALLEIFRGVNYFRRALGVVVLIVAVASFFSFGL